MVEKIVNIGIWLIIILIFAPLVAGLIWAINEDKKETSFVLTVTSKEAITSGMVCFGDGVRFCDATHEYYVNGEKVQKWIYDSVTEGYTYICYNHDHECKLKVGEEQ